MKQDENVILPTVLLVLTVSIGLIGGTLYLSNRH